MTEDMTEGIYDCAEDGLEEPPYLTEALPTLADATEEDSAVRKVRNAREQAGIERADNLEMLLRSRGTALSQVGHDRDSKQSDKI